MSRDNKELLAYSAFVAAFFAIAIGVLLWVKSAQCHARYAEHGETSYRLVAGCMVKHNGKWKPSTVFREVTP